MIKLKMYEENDKMLDREMLMKCAKALFDLDQDKAYTQQIINPIMYGVQGKVEWDFITDEQKVITTIANGYVSQVKAVIKAMREPTEKMVEAAFGKSDLTPHPFRTAWYNMIDAITND